MVLIDWVIFILFFVFCIALALYFYNRYDYFKKYKGFLTLLIIGFAAIFLHNGIYGLFRVEEPVFFLVAIVALITGIANLVIWIMYKVVSKSRTGGITKSEKSKSVSEDSKIKNSKREK